MIPLKFIDKHRNRPVCCDHTIVDYEGDTNDDSEKQSEEGSEGTVRGTVDGY